MTIRLNGKPHPLEDGASVARLLETLGFAGQPVLVEINGSALLAAEHAATVLQDGDVVELVRIVAGG